MLGLVSISPFVSVALVSTLATVSVHFRLCRVGLHTCHSVSPLLSLSPWSPHLPQCQSTASSSVSVTVREVIPTAPLNEGIVNGYRRHSQNSCSYLLPQGLNPNPHGSHYNFLSGFAVRIECDRARVDFLPQLGLPVNSRGGGPRSLTWRVSDWSTSVACWYCLHVLDPDLLSAVRRVAVLFVCSLCVAPAVFVSWTRGVYPWEPVWPSGKAVG